MKNKIVAICVMLVLTIATGFGLVAVSGEDNGVPPLPNPFMITELNEGWNMVGYPNQGSVDLDLLSIVYDNITYAWFDAWQQNIILRFVYNWDRENQYYDVVDEIEGGEGYWLWAYYDCELWSLV